MSNEQPNSPDLANIDLSLSFAPAWVKEANPSQDFARLAAKHGGSDRGDRTERRADDRRSRSERPPLRRSGGGNNDWRDDRRGSRPSERPAPAPRPIAPLRDWDIRFIPHTSGVEGLNKQIRTTLKAYSLFDLARLVLEKSERYQVEFRRATPSAPALFQLNSDGTVWLSEGDAISHALATQLDKYYRRDRITVDPPKGNYAFVAVCGMSGALLGPPNFHDYQDKIRKLHASKFASVPFETFKSRIRTERDEALIEKWKEEQSSKDVFYPLDTPEGEEPLKLETAFEIERHFRTHYAAAEVTALKDRGVVPGPAALNDSAPSVLALTRQVWDELDRFPLPLAQLLGERLTAKGLQIFKAQKNQSFVGVARPRFLDRQVSPISGRLEAILSYLESHSTTPRAEQWKALIELSPAPAEGESDTRESTMATDLSWLLHEGHVVDYAGRSLVASRKAEKQEGHSGPRKNQNQPPRPKPESAARPAPTSPPLVEQ